MSRLNVNPTRMELKKLKARLKTATRGHKLLKDKADEMIRRFSVLIKLNKNLRDEVEKAMGEVLKEFSYAKGQLSKAALENAFLMPTACWLGALLIVSAIMIRLLLPVSGRGLVLQMFLPNRVPRQLNRRRRPGFLTNSREVCPTGQVFSSSLQPAGPNISPTTPG